MIVRAFAIAVVLLLAPTTAELSASYRPSDGTTQTVRGVGDGGTPPPVTVNEFLPEDRGLGECISALPKPGCGSEARGGWRQGLVLLSIVAGLTFIAWRIVVGARRARRSPETLEQPERETT